MTTATASPAAQEKTKAKKTEYDPDSFRMTIGEHLEDLRRRLIFAIIGLAVAVFGLMPISQKIMVFICAPLTHQLWRHHINPQLTYTGLTDSFMTYLKVTIIGAIAVAGPWIIYQMWLFVAAGLYPHERKTITRYIPLSITLFLVGLIFVYVLVLPLSIEFFLDFAGSFSVPPGTPTSQVVQGAAGTHLASIAGDPADPHPGDMWINTVEARVKILMPSPDGDPKHATISTLPFGPEKLLTPMIVLPDYIDLVLTFMLTFGLAFQLPLVILAVVGIGLVDVPFLKKQRKIVYFVMTIAAAVLAPGDIVTSMLALLIPLVLLYEFGLWLVAIAERRKAREAAAE